MKCEFCLDIYTKLPCTKDCPFSPAGNCLLYIDGTCDKYNSYERHNGDKFCPHCGHPLTKPEALSLERLRGMEKAGIGCYVKRMDGTPMFRGNIFTAATLDTVEVPGVFGKRDIIAIYGRNLTLAESDYGKTWLAYTHKPEQEGEI